MADRALTYAELMALARENYNKGGDGYFGPITKARALQMFAAAFDEEKEERAIAQAAMKGEW